MMLVLINFELFATGPGTMKDYLNYLNQNPTYQDFYNSLQKAGGYNGALSGTDMFKEKWKEYEKKSFFSRTN